MAITPLTGTDTFQTWFNTTNSLITFANGVTVYSIAGSTGIGITLASNIATISNTGVLSFNGSTGTVVGVGSVNGSTGSINLVAGSNITITQTGNTYTFASAGGISGSVVTAFNGLTGGVTGIVSINAGSGINVSVGTSPTISNTGVLSINSSTGAITNVAKTDTAQTFGALQTFDFGISASNGITFSSNIGVNGINFGIGNGTTASNIAIGSGLLNLTPTATLGHSNIIIGNNAGVNVTTGAQNVGIGRNSLRNLTTANSNTAIGNNSSQSITTGGSNVSVGAGALRSNQTGSSNVAIGSGSLLNATTVSTSISIGNNAMANATGTPTSNIGIGSGVMNSISGSSNIAVGNGSLPTTGNYNVAVGNSILASTNDGSYNVGIGEEALFSLITGSNNVAVGARSLRADKGNVDIGTADNCVFVGYDSRSSGDAITNEIAIGYSSYGFGSNTTTLGNTFTVATRIYGVNVTGQTAPTIASASTITPTQPITFVSGTTTIDTITVPLGITNAGVQITLIPTGLWSGSTFGNISLPTTAVVNRALIMTYDAQTTKWYPSY